MDGLQPRLRSGRRRLDRPGLSLDRRDVRSGGRSASGRSFPQPADLPPGRSIRQASSVDTTAIADNTYYVIVKTDAGNTVFEDGRDDNNVRVSTDPFRLGVPTLTLGQSVTDTFASSGQSKYYRVEVDAGQHLFVSLDDLNDIGSNELYIKYGSAPTRSRL